MNCHVCERCSGRGVLWDGRTERPCFWCDGRGALRPGPRKTGRPGPGLVDALLDAGLAAAFSFGAAVAYVKGLPVPAAAAFLVSAGWWSYAVRNAWDAGPRKTGRPTREGM